MKIKIDKGIARGAVEAPPSKSYAHRLLICSALAQGESTVCGISESEDMVATLACLDALGVKYNKTGDTVSVNGGIREGTRLFDCRESGSTLRFFIPIALLTGEKCVFTGTERLISRGIGVYEEIFKSRDIFYSIDKASVTVEGKLKAGEFNVRGDISSQFISGLLFALPLLDGDSRINITTELESSAYVDITIETLSSFGVKIERKGNAFFIKGNQKYTPASIKVEGDLSNSAFLDALNCFGGEVCVNNINENTIQGDKVYREYFKLLAEGSPTVDISACPDLGPILFAVAGAKNGATVTGTRRLKIKESDRVLSMKTELEKLCITVTDCDDYVVIANNGFKAPNKELYGHNDHRIVMALSVLLTACGGVIDGYEAVKKSYPDFFKVLARLGINCEVIE
ncbi:MAG: 3-phosphoshikimate 1-carboxyvinyltransferase [Clostridia bacterium]|nr:3-phosphoshikimate 1-carboxyvinyltransferase [Clostridia bacterium]